MTPHRRAAALSLFALPALAALLAFPASPTAGCSGGYDCSTACDANQSAIFVLSCAPSDLTSVALSGACAGPSSSPSNYLFGPSNVYLAITSANPGDCNVVLTFASGFTYSAVVNFEASSGASASGCTCSQFTLPAQHSYNVNNPSATCADGGDDAGGDAGEAGAG
ncbi:MAG: hypothetical protein ACLQVI_00075 [Polyangiaceae bacterium]